VVLNDFAAVGHAVAQLPDTHFLALSGPARPAHSARLISIIGPGTGLGVAQVIRGPERYAVVATEGGHIGYAPADTTDETVLALARARFGRVSAERLLSGAGLALHYEALAGHAAPFADDARLWQAALSGEDAAAAAALERYCLGLGRFAGDIALAHGADAVVVAGGLGLRLGDRLSGGAFAQGFYDKGRFADIMRTLPVTLVTEPQPGLYGAAAAFAQEFQG
jgi:glucokinase